MDIAKQVNYWLKGGREDMAAARSLLEKGHVRHALFFAHLALEKTLKAHVTDYTKAVPPRIHNLTRLAEMTALTLTAQQRAFLLTFDVHQLEGRYPDPKQARITRKTGGRKIIQAEEMRKWLTAQL